MDAFAFGRSERLLFSPDDRLLDVHRAICPRRRTPDALEFETLARDLEGRLGIRLETLWHDDLTLGEVFSAAEARLLDAH